MKKPILFFAMLIFLLLPHTAHAATHWQVQSIDTMKYSRDAAREALTSPSFNKNVIEKQVSQIAATGVTHIAISTPYDAEFLPVLKQWVAEARKHQLSVWFRGNWSGWEGWFGYPKISREEHLDKTRTFIRENPDLFLDGDIFTACPECENGGPGDPRQTGDVAGFRKFIIDLHLNSQAAFRTLRKNVSTNYFSFNGDVAKLVMNKETTASLGGIVVVDHYVKSPQQLVDDVAEIATKSGGKVILGEFGSPIPDIHGNQSPAEQARWLDEALNLLFKESSLIGVNYWTSFGGSTKIWDDNGNAHPAVKVLKNYFSPPTITLHVTNALSEKLPRSWAVYLGNTHPANSNGEIRLPYLRGNNQLQISAPGYNDSGVLLSENTLDYKISLKKSYEDLLFKIRRYIYSLLRLNQS